MEIIIQETTQIDDNVEAGQKNLIASVVHFLTDLAHECVVMQNRVDNYSEVH